MVTFALPGDNEVAAATNGTPRSRPPLPFAAKRGYNASPFAPSSARRLGTPQTASARKLLTTRDEIPASSLNGNSIATARNIFRASTISDSPPVTSFSPSLPQSTMTKLFAPGATPDPSRIQRGNTAQATPRGMAAKVTSKELFSMRIASPPPELTGEALTQKVPKGWNSKGSIYADQFLAHLCPQDLDEEQRRQFFCILDLRRLKYAANEIFAKKDWKLNVINFAKEFEKSRSIILLRYGLYEFQNVKPSKDVLKRWRREHGLPEPEEEQAEPTPTKISASKKRKADEEASGDKTPAGAAKDGKRRATDKTSSEESTPVTATPSFGNNKRKASTSEEQPAKIQKATPSSAKSLFEKIANKSTTKTVEEAPAAKPSPFFANKPASNSLARSVFTNLKPSGGQAGAGSNNIFGYLSDASSAKNSGVDADAESETDSDADDSPGAGQSEPSVAASGAGDSTSLAGSNLFGKKPVADTGASSTPETRESTPGRSLFDRISKPGDSQPAPASTASDAVPSSTAAPSDQTWNPSKTPMKFAPAAAAPAGGSLFGASSATSSASIFAPKTAASNLFGVSTSGQTSEKGSSGPSSAAEADKSGGESDKENDSHGTKSVEVKAPSTQPSFGSSLFQPKPPSTEAAPKPVGNLFGAPKTGADAPAPASSLFGSVSKPVSSAPASGTVMQSSTLFGAKPAEPVKKTEAAVPNATTLFGAQPASKPAETNTASSLFGAKPATAPSSLFGSGASTPSQQPLFGGAGSTTAPKTDAAQPTKPVFSFGAPSTGGTNSGAASQAASKPLFGVPKSPPTAGENNMFGSPMKQDDPSPAKKMFTGGASGSSGSLFGFGNTAQTTSATTNLFGATSGPAPTNGTSAPSGFGGAAPTNTGSGGFGFNFSAGGGAAASGSGFNNPFANNTGNAGSAQPSTAGGMFSFGAAPGPAAAATSTFQFGGAGGGNATPAGGSLFGGNQSTQNAAPAFGGSSAPAGAPAFNFTAASPQPPQGAVSIFGSNQQQPTPAFGVNLQPPVGGSSTTGTNSPFHLAGGSSLATTPAGGTPEPTSRAEEANGAANDDGEKHEQISLTEGLEADEEILHEVRAKVLKFIPASEKSDDEPKSKSPWSTQGVGPLRLLKHKETGAVRLLLRAEPRGHVALNRAILPDLSYKADEKYVRMATSNEKGDGLETWMIQVKTKDLAKALAEALEKYKELNKQK